MKEDATSKDQDSNESKIIVKNKLKKEICMFLGVFWTLNNWFDFCCKHVTAALIFSLVFFYLSESIPTGVFMFFASLALLRGFWSLSRNTFGDIEPKLAIKVGLD